MSFKGSDRPVVDSRPEWHLVCDDCKSESRPADNTYTTWIETPDGKKDVKVQMCFCDICDRKLDAYVRRACRHDVRGVYGAKEDIEYARTLEKWEWSSEVYQFAKRVYAAREEDKKWKEEQKRLEYVRGLNTNARGGQWARRL